MGEQGELAESELKFIKRNLDPDPVRPLKYRKNRPRRFYYFFFSCFWFADPKFKRDRWMPFIFALFPPFSFRRFDPGEIHEGC